MTMTMKMMMMTMTKIMMLMIIIMIKAAMVIMPMMWFAGVSGEEDQRSGQRTALCNEGPEESYSERWKRRAEI